MVKKSLSSTFFKTIICLFIIILSTSTTFAKTHKFWKNLEKSFKKTIQDNYAMQNQNNYSNNFSNLGSNNQEKFANLMSRINLLNNAQKEHLSTTVKIVAGNNNIFPKLTSSELAAWSKYNQNISLEEMNNYAIVAREYIRLYKLCLQETNNLNQSYNKSFNSNSYAEQKERVIEWLYNQRKKDNARGYSSSSSSYPEDEEQVCSDCNGTGQSRYNIYRPVEYGYTETHYEYCDICRRSAKRHVHEVCGLCRGRGKR